MKKIIPLILILCRTLFSHAETSVVKGKIVEEQTGNVLPGVTIIFPRLKTMTITDSGGVFYIPHIPYGKHEMVISDSRLKERIKIMVTDTLTELGILAVRIPGEAVTPAEGPAQVLLQEAEQNEHSSGAQISGILNASRDIYLSAAAFNLGPLRYQVRGYKRDQQEVYMNGLLLNDAETGMAFWNHWGGLNDVFRNQDITFALSPADAGIGGMAGTTSIDASAVNQRKQLRTTYSISNRSYRNRLMLTYSTGLLPAGWAFSFSGSRRWSGEGYIPGTFLNSYSWFASISKKLGSTHYLHLITFGSPTVKGKAMPATREAAELAGNNYYNPNWGWQDGSKRNARINEYFQPAVIISYEYRPDAATFFTVSAMYQQGYNSNSALDWYNAQDPRPDYYRKLPGYYLQHPVAPDTVTAYLVSQQFQEDPDKMQIDWERIYEANRLNTGSMNTAAGSRSLYVIGEDRDDSRKFSAAVNFHKAMGNHFTFYLGEFLTTQYTNSYRRLQDLLGGDFYVNLNQFAERTYPGNILFNQNDLNNPNGIIKTGDKYNYNYNAQFIKLYAWSQVHGSFKKIDAFAAGRAGLDIFRREGIFRNGLFPQRSAGKSASNNFYSYTVKAGITFKINGRNYLFFNGLLSASPPSFDNTYISPRTRNDVIQDPVTRKIYSMEGGYLLRTPGINGRLTGYSTEIRDITEIRRFYHEDYRTFVNYVMTHLDIRHLGAELALKLKLSATLSTTLIASWKQAFYSNRPDISIYKDNDTSSRAATSIAYIKNFHIAAGPQSAYVISLNYNAPKFWYANISWNYTDRNYIDINPSRRTADAMDLLTPDTDEWNTILVQERLPRAFTIDIFAGKSFLLSKVMKWLPYGTYLYMNLGVNNILNNRNIITGGFEQLRYDYTSRNPERFPSKYFYAQGVNYFLNLSLKL